MAQITSDGKERIQSNDGKVGFSINDNQVNVMDEAGQVLKIAEEGLVSQDATDTSRMQIGREVKLSQPTVDVIDAPLVDTIIDSDQLNAFKIIQSGTVNLVVPNPPTAGATYTATVNHALGFVPAADVYVTPAYTPINQWRLPHSIQVYNSSTGLWDFAYWMEYYLDDQNIYFRFRATSYVLGGGTQVIRYYLLREIAN